MTDYRTQDPAALHKRIAELEAQLAKPRRKLTQRGWLMVIHVATMFVTIACIAADQIDAFGIDGAWGAVGIPAAMWSCVAFGWSMMRADVNKEAFTETLR